MREIFWLEDDAWGVIEPHLPTNQPGARRVDDRRIITAASFTFSESVGKKLSYSQ